MSLRSLSPSEMNSLDPRVGRLPDVGTPGPIRPKVPLDQFGTYEVFVQPREGKPFQHEGIVHAPNLELAYVLAKEAFTRRFTCTSLFVVDTRHVFATETTEGDTNAFGLVDSLPHASGESASYEVFLLFKRGKQHVHAGTFMASGPEDAMLKARERTGITKIVYNIWAIPTASIRFTTAEERDLWATLPDKKFRDAGDYKGGEKLKAFLESRK